VSLFQIFCSGFSILSIAVLHIVLAKSYILIKTQNVETPEFIAKFGPLVKGQNVINNIDRYWTVISLLRQSVLSVTLVCLRDFPAIQIIVLLVQSIIMQVLIIRGKPLIGPLENWMALFNEAMISVYLYVSIALTGFNLIHFTFKLALY
jgi:hypothetical protein